MAEIKFDVKTESVDEYNNRLDEFKELLAIWESNKNGREYEIVEDVENLKFKIKAKRYGEN